MKKKIKQANNKNGSTLVVVLGVSAVVLILLLMSMSISKVARENTYSGYCQEQAYLTAKSALNKVITNMSDNADMYNFIDSMPYDSVYVSNDVEIGGMGKVVITVKKDEAGQVTVLASTNYQDKKSTAAAIINKSPKNDKKILFNAATVSFDNSLFSNNYISIGNALSDTALTMPNNSQIRGNIYINGMFEVSNNSVVLQGTDNQSFTILATEDIHFTNNAVLLVRPDVTDAFIHTFKKVSLDSNVQIGSSEHKIDIYCTDFFVTNGCNLYSDIFVSKTKTDPPTIPNIEITSSCNIYGNIHIDGNLSIQDKPYIDGNVYVEGTLTTTGDVHITGDVYCNSFIDLSHGQAIIDGNIHCTNSLDGTIYATQRVWNETTDRPLLSISDIPEFPTPETVFKPYDGKAEDYIDYEELASADTYNAAATSEITKSCVLEHDMWQNNITVKVKDNPIWIKLDMTQIGKSQIFIEHDSEYPNTPVYFVVPSGHSLDLNNASTVVTDVSKTMIDNGDTFCVANYADETKPVLHGQNVYWFLEKDSKLTMANGSFAEGYFYGPEADITCSSVPNTDINFTTDGVNIETNRFELIGAVIARKIKLSEGCSILYLNPDVENMPDNITNPINGSSSGGSSIDYIWQIESYIKK